MKRPSISILSLSLCLVLAACSSKFQEQKPEGAQADPSTKKELSLKAHDIQKRISEAQDILNGINIIMAKFSISNVSKASISDLMTEILDSVKTAQTQKNSSGYTSDGEVYLNFPGISKDCQLIQTRSVFTETPTQTSHQILVNTCKTKGIFKSILELILTGDSVISITADKDIKNILPDLDLNELVSAQNCHLQKDANDNISNIDCQASNLVLNAHEQIIFTKISYQKGVSPLFSADGTLEKDSVPTFDLVFELDKDGKPYSKATPIAAPTTQDNTQSTP